MAVNTEWHSENLLTSNASQEERIAFHTAHAQACDCRPIPADLYDILTKTEQA